MWELQGERLIGAAGCVAGAQKCFEKTLTYAHERKAFGREIGKFQVIRHKFAEMATKIESARQMVYVTAWRFNNGEYPVREISMAKLHASRIACEVADECIQIHGGAGYMREYGVERVWRDMRLNRIGAGHRRDHARRHRPLLRPVISALPGEHLDRRGEAAAEACVEETEDERGRDHPQQTGTASRRWAGDGRTAPRGRPPAPASPAGGRWMISCISLRKASRSWSCPGPARGRSQAPSNRPARDPDAGEHERAPQRHPGARPPVHRAGPEQQLAGRPELLTHHLPGHDEQPRDRAPQGGRARGVVPGHERPARAATSTARPRSGASVGRGDTRSGSEPMVGILRLLGLS